MIEIESPFRCPCCGDYEEYMWGDMYMCTNPTCDGMHITNDSNEEETETKETG